MASKAPFTRKLAEIASKLESEKLEKLKFLCKDVIPDGDREKISSPEKLFLELEQRRKISADDLRFLVDCLKKVGRDDLAEDLETFGNDYRTRKEKGLDADAATRDSSKQASFEKSKSVEADAEKYNERGRVEFQNKHFEAALRQYTCALECLPEDQEELMVKYLCNRAACYVNLRKFKEGRNDCDKALLLRPRGTKARYRLAQCLEGEGKISDALFEVTSLLESSPRDSGIIKLEKSLKEKVKVAEARARARKEQGIKLFRQSQYQEAIITFSEAIMFTPRLPTNNKEIKDLYWYRGESRLRSTLRKHLEAARNDCEEAQRLVPDDVMVLYTWMQVLDRLNKYEECCGIANQLISKGVKEEEAKQVLQRLLPKIGIKGEGPHKAQKKKNVKKKESKKEKTPERDAPVEGTRVEEASSNSKIALSDPGPSSRVLQSVEDVDDSKDAAAGEMPVRTECLQDESDEQEKVEVCVPPNQYHGPVNDGPIHDTACSDSGSELEEITYLVPVIDKQNQKEQRNEIPVSDFMFKTDKAEDKRFIDKPLTCFSGVDDGTLTESFRGDIYPRRILCICDHWSSLYRSVCTVNRQLCRSFAKSTDVHVACLVLDATDQEKIGATRDNIHLIKASHQPGMRDDQLLFLHANVPFKVDLVVGHGMVTGPAAACQARMLECRRLHIFHKFPRKGRSSKDSSSSREKETAERELGLSADFVAAIGPLLVEEWSMTLNREVFLIMPGMPDVPPRNAIPSPQCRCLLLGNMSNYKLSGLNLVTVALLNCRKRFQGIRFVVQGVERDKVHELERYLRIRCQSSQVDVVVKPFDVSRETIGVEVRGVSLVLMPPRSEGFGLMALEAISAGVPTLVSSSSGLARVLCEEFGEEFSDLLCTMEDSDEWTNAIDEILDESEAAFKLASTLREKWKSKFSWDASADELLKGMACSGFFSLLSPSANMNIALPSECSESALRFMEEEVDLLNRRRRHVLIVSPEDNSKSPFIKCFAQVPWIAVFDFDVDSVKTGYLASCEGFCENMGMKICRVLPQAVEEDHKRYSAMLPNGIPWVLLEGMPECQRNVTENLEWIREFFLALTKTHRVPITFVVLWRCEKKTRLLCKRLSKILTIAQGSPLHRQLKLVIASTGDTVDVNLEDIAEDWSVEVQPLALEDVCNALCRCVSSSPFLQENLDYALPVADPDDPQNVSFKLLPPSSRWINAEMEVLYQSVGSTPAFESDDAYHFYRGGLISWYALQMGYAVERRNWEALKIRIDELLMRTGTMRLKMPHQRGAGGTTSARKILFDYHDKYPCVFLNSINHSEVASAINVLSAFCRLPVIVLVDCKQVQSDEFDVDMLYDSLSTDRIPSLILEVIHQSQQREKDSKATYEKTTPVRLADALHIDEANEFVKIYSNQKKDKLGALNSLLRCREQLALQIPFYYALVTFEDRFTALEPFVRECLQDLCLTERQVLLFLAMAYHYGHSSLSAFDFAGLLQAPRRDVLSLEEVLSSLTMELLLEEDGKWRPRHDLIAVEMLRQLLTMQGVDGSPAIHADNWKNHLADKAIDFFTHMSESVVSNVLLSRISDDNLHQLFSQLICDIPFDEDAIRLFEKATSVFPDNPFFKVHLGRFYSIQKKSAGFPLAIKYTNEGIACSDDYPSRVVRGQFAQMKGVVYSREVYNLAESNVEIQKIIDMADEGVKNFRRAVSIAPDLVDGYIPEVKLMCKVFEHIDKTTGSFCDYVKSPHAHPYIIDAISNTSNTLECVPDSDEYAYWRMRLACLGRKHFTPQKMEETMNLLMHLRNSDRASRGSINRQIVLMSMEMQAMNKLPISLVAPTMIPLLNEALRYDSNIEQTMRLWVRLAPFIPVSFAEAESKIFHWCLKEKSVRSYLYKYIIACIQLLERGSRSYSEIMKNAKEDLNSTLKAINRVDVGRCRHPDRPVVWLGQQGRGMGNLVFLDEKISDLVDIRMKRFIAPKYTKQLRPLTGRIAETGHKVGTIRVNEELDVSFRADLCETPLVSSAFTNKKVRFFLAFTFFGVDAFNVQLVHE